MTVYMIVGFTGTHLTGLGFNLLHVSPQCLLFPLSSLPYSPSLLSSSSIYLSTSFSLVCCSYSWNWNSLWLFSICVHVQGVIWSHPFHISSPSSSQPSPTSLSPSPLFFLCSYDICSPLLSFLCCSFCTGLMTFDP